MKQVSGGWSETLAEIVQSIPPVDIYLTEDECAEIKRRCAKKFDKPPYSKTFFAIRTLKVFKRFKRMRLFKKTVINPQNCHD